MELNKWLDLSKWELKTLKFYFDNINTSKKNIYRLFLKEWKDFSDKLIELCNQAVEQKQVSEELRRFIQDKNFQNKFKEYSKRIKDFDSGISKILLEWSGDFIWFESIINRISTQLPWLTILWNSDTAKDNIDKSNKQTIKTIVNALKKQNIAHNIFDDNNWNSEIEKIQVLICAHTKNKTFAKAYKYICEIIYADNQNRWIVPKNRNDFVKNMYNFVWVELPPEESLQITKVQDEYIWQTKTKKEFLKIQDLDFDEINIWDEVLWLYDNKNKWLHYFDIWGQAKLTAKIKESNTNNNTKIGKIFKIKITTKIPNRWSKKDKKPYYFHGEIV